MPKNTIIIRLKTLVKKVTYVKSLNICVHLPSFPITYNWIKFNWSRHSGGNKTIKQPSQISMK